MRLFPLALVGAAALTLAGCATPSRGQPPTKLTTGFWFWQGSALGTANMEPVEDLFVEVGALSHKHAYANAPRELPAAKTYWFVYRLEERGLPGANVIPELVTRIAALKRTAMERNLNLAGIQLDIDSPTHSLPEYAAFLKDLRKEMPTDLKISITALLDWFNSGTAIGDVIDQVDEFVPQFYDIVEPQTFGNNAVIASPIDSKWGPIFNRYQKPFRIGISSFGRARRLERSPSSRTGYLALSRFRDLEPIDIAANPSFELEVKRDSANELLLNYHVKQDVIMGRSKFVTGDIIQFILSTPESIQAAMHSVRQIGGNVMGVVFFRWPGSNEALAMQPREVLSAAGFASATQRPPAVDAIDGECAAVRCVDVYLETSTPYSPAALTYRIQSSVAFEYFLPDRGAPVRMSGPDQLEIKLPSYCARGRLYLGRAITKKQASFRVEEHQ